MNSIPDPVLGGSDFAGSVENRLKADQRCVVLGGQSGNHILPCLNAGAPCCVAVLPFANRQREGLTQHDPELGVRCLRLGNEFIVSALIFIVGTSCD